MYRLKRWKLVKDKDDLFVGNKRNLYFNENQIMLVTNYNKSL